MRSAFLGGPVPDWVCLPVGPITSTLFKIELFLSALCALPYAALNRRTQTAGTDTNF